MDLEDNITLDDIQNFTEKHGRPHTQRLLSILGKHHEFYQAFKSDLGQELMKDLMTKMDYLLGKILESKASTEETIEYGVCREIFEAWAKKLKIYINHVNKIKGKE